MQAHSVSLTLQHVNKGRYEDARTTKLFNCLHITSKATSDKRQEVPVLLGGKLCGRQTRDGRQGQTDRFLTERTNGLTESMANLTGYQVREGTGFGGQQVNYVTL